MSETVTDLRTLNQTRLRSFVLPREHGAWGILLVPLVTSATVSLLRGGAVVPVLLFLAAAMSLFCLRTPVEALLGTSVQRIDTPAERRLVMIAIVGYSVVAAIALAALLWKGIIPACWRWARLRRSPSARKLCCAGSAARRAWPRRSSGWSV